MIKTKTILIVSGEDSGDKHAAELVRSLKKHGDFRFFGATGQRMRDEGVESVVHSDDFGIFGIIEVAKSVPMFLGVMKKLVAAAESNKPDLVVLVDFPEFNLKLAKRLKKKGFKIVYYISPQLWAWRSYRVTTIDRYVDRLLTILPFEKEWYASRGVTHVSYVGHPLAGVVNPTQPKSEFLEAQGIHEGSRVIALLPGSRRKEIERNFPEMVKGVRLLNDRIGSVDFIVALARSRSADEVKKVISHEWPEGTSKFRIVRDKTCDVLNAADVAVVASGTATLETALIGTPQVIVYKTSGLNYAMFKQIVPIRQFGLANLIAGEPVFKELIQNDFTADSLCEELVRLLEPETNQRLRKSAAKISDLLGSKNATENASLEIAAILDPH